MQHIYILYIYFFFQLPKLNKYCLGAELAPAHQVIKKLKMDHLWATRIPLHAATATECDKKKNKQTNKKGMPGTEILNACSR